MRTTYSLMEERAKRYPLLERHPDFSMLPPTKEDKEKELQSLAIILRDISTQLTTMRKELKKKEKQFSLFANYKYLLEKTLTPVLKCPSPSSTGKKQTEAQKKKDKIEALINQIEAFTPAQKEFLKSIE